MQAAQFLKLQSTGTANSSFLLVEAEHAGNIAGQGVGPNLSPVHWHFVACWAAALQGNRDEIILMLIDLAAVRGAEFKKISSPSSMFTWFIKI